VAVAVLGSVRNLSGLFSPRQKAFPFQNGPNVFEDGFYILFWKSDLPETVDIRKFRTALFKKDDGLGEAEPPLEQSDFMDNILSCMQTAVGSLIFRCHNQKREGRSVQQFR